MKTKTDPDVRPGQVWEDNDYRMRGRTVRVLSVEDGRASVVVLTTSDAAIGGKGRVLKIAVRRFVPNSSGYRLVTDAPAAGDYGTDRS